MNATPSSTMVRRIGVSGAMAVALMIAFVLGGWLLGTGAGAPVEGHAEHAAADHADAQVWTCSMHPQIRQDGPGSCPICGMNLIPVTQSTGGSALDRVVLSDRARILSKLQTTSVRRQTDAAAAVHLLGRIEAAESTRRNVTTWVGGRIDRLHVNVTGERVRRGQTIATLYSPEVYSAHQDLITARSQVTRLADGAPGARQAAVAALAAARERLRLVGVPDAELQRMVESSEPTRALAIRSPFSGTVIERVATEGAYVETGATLYRVADLGTLWVQLDAYESDLARLEVGQSVELRVDAMPGRSFDGRLAFIDPTLDAQRRTARVRVVVDNADGSLRPGMFAEANVSAPPIGNDAPLVIPETSALFTGKRSVVYVEVPNDGGVAYEPRTVRLGPRLGAVYPVVSGLSEGERVVSRGAFALDADLQIRGGPSMMAGLDDLSPEGFTPVPLTAAQRSTLSSTVRAYLDIQTALAEDDHSAAVAAATALASSLRTVALPPSADEAWQAIQTELGVHGQHVSTSADLEGARGGFEALSAAIERLLVQLGNPLKEEVQVSFCPMANGNRGARWVQEVGTIDNAYFGSSMRTCGEVRAQVSGGTYLPAPSPEAPRLGAAPHAGHNH